MPDYQNLSQLFAPRPQVQPKAVMETNDPIELRGLQDARRGELEERLANELGTGDRGAARRSSTQLGFLADDMAGDPYTGDAAHEQTQNIENQLSQAATFMRPEVMGARQQQQKEQVALDTSKSRVAGDYALLAAQINAQGGNARWQAGQDQINARQDKTQANVAERQRVSQEGLQQRQRAGQAEIQARNLETKRVKPTIPDANGFLEQLLKLGGFGKFDPETAARSQASQLRSQALSQAAQPGDETPESVAQKLVQRFGIVTPDTIMDQLGQLGLNMDEVDPSEVDQVLAAVAQGRQ